MFSLAPCSGAPSSTAALLYGGRPTVWRLFVLEVASCVRAVIHGVCWSSCMHCGTRGCCIALCCVWLRCCMCCRYVVSCRYFGLLPGVVWLYIMARLVLSWGNTRCVAVYCCLVSCLVGVLACCFPFVSRCVAHRAAWRGVLLRLGAPRRGVLCWVVSSCVAGVLWGSCPVPLCLRMSRFVL